VLTKKAEGFQRMRDPAGAYSVPGDRRRSEPGPNFGRSDGMDCDFPKGKCLQYRTSTSCAPGVCSYLPMDTVGNSQTRIQLEQCARAQELLSASIKNVLKVSLRLTNTNCGAIQAVRTWIQMMSTGTELRRASCLMAQMCEKRCRKLTDCRLKKRKNILNAEEAGAMFRDAMRSTASVCAHQLLYFSAAVSV